MTTIMKMMKAVSRSISYSYYISFPCKSRSFILLYKGDALGHCVLYAKEIITECCQPLGDNLESHLPPIVNGITRHIVASFYD